MLERRIIEEIRGLFDLRLLLISLILGSIFFNMCVCLCCLYLPTRAVSTFWIANPNNNLISNAAAGSQVITRGLRDQTAAR